MPGAKLAILGKHGGKSDGGQMVAFPDIHKLNATKNLQVAITRYRNVRMSGKSDKFHDYAERQRASRQS